MGFNYHYCIIYLTEHYKDINDFDELQKLKEFYANKLQIGFNPEYEQRF